MKHLKIKIKIIVAAVCFFYITEAFAIDSSINVKTGLSYPFGLKMPALDIGLDWDFGLHPAFAFNLESGFSWVSLKNYSGGTLLADPDSVIYSDAFTVPLMLNFKLRFDLRGWLGFMIYLTAGGGYSWMFNSAGQSPSVKNTDEYGGFVWQVVLGTAGLLSGYSKSSLILEIGYRSLTVNLKSNLYSKNLDMSSIFFHAGLSFDLFSDR